MRTRPLGRWLAGLGVVVGLVLVMLVWFALQVHPLTSPGRPVVVTVAPGDSMSTIAAHLHEDGVIASPLAFRLDLALFGGVTVQPGNYGLDQGSSFATVRRVLGSASNVLDVEPGLTLHEVALDAASIAGNGFGDAFVRAAATAAAHSPYHPASSLEGLVGPGLYPVMPGETAAQLVAAMTTAFAREAAAAGLTPSTSVEGLDAYQAVVAASIDQKEGYYSFNMPDVARVIFNRLAKGSPLQMDSTVLYYFHQDGGTVTHAMLETPTPYNTYLNTGLTPTPICTVSAAALRAVLHAPPGPWLYFTLVNRDGEMKFSATFAEQLAWEAVAAKRGIT